MDALTLIHVALSLIGIGTGFIVLGGMLTRRPLDGWTAIFLVTTVLTSGTGFLFPFEKLLPSHVLGIISLVVLAAAIFARYHRGLAGAWRPVFVITALVAQYLNVFVLIVQAFLKLPALHDLAPTQSEPPFLFAQLANLILFVVLTALALIRFREPAPPRN
ncbi:MAG: hypothetical protein AB7O59_11685 [Pirellulales bacterium]